MQPIFAYTHRQWVDHLKQQHGTDPQLAIKLYRTALKGGPQALAGMTAKAVSPLRGALQAALEAHIPRVVETLRDETAEKCVFRLSDGHLVEGVLVPMANHHTLCVSTQVGCRMGCRFCETGRQPWVRDLTAAEIVGQVYWAKTIRGHHVRNVVFMGMGEPLDNFDNLSQAIAVLHDQHGLDIALRYITVSTVGLLPVLERLAGRPRPRVNLALSLNAPSDRLRTELMPINRTYDMGALRRFLENYPRSPKEFVLVGYILIKNLNDSPAHARQLGEYLRGLAVKLNLIPYNPQREAPFEGPTAAELDRFRDWIVAERIFVRRRTPKGASVMAGCGQLGNRRGPTLDP